MKAASQSIPFVVPAQDRSTERDIPDDRLDCSEFESDDTAWQDFLAYHSEVLR
jgi:hypothetical protein